MLSRLHDVLLPRVLSSPTVLPSFLDAVLEGENARRVLAVKPAGDAFEARFGDGSRRRILLRAPTPGDVRRRALEQAVGEEGESLPRIVLLLADFEDMPEEPELHHVFELRGRGTGRLLTGGLQIHLVEIPKIVGQLGQGLPARALHRWLLYLHDLRHPLLPALIAAEPAIARALAAETLALLDREVVDRYEEGRAAGLMEGRALAYREVAGRLVRLGLVKSAVSRAVGLPVEELPSG